jgi:hypothetical protein
MHAHQSLDLLILDAHTLRDFVTLLSSHRGLSRNPPDVSGSDQNLLGIFLNLNGRDRAKISGWIPTGSDQNDLT